MSKSEFEDTGFEGLDKGEGMIGFRAFIWLLADPNKDTYDPARALKMLNDAIVDKWRTVQHTSETIGKVPNHELELEQLLPKPIVDRGGKSVDVQLRQAVTDGLAYLAKPDHGWHPEYPHERARKNLGFIHERRDDTPEQEKSLSREELRIVHETALRAAIYDLGTAVDNQHLVYLQSKVDQFQASLARYSDPVQQSPLNNPPGISPWQPS